MLVIGAARAKQRCGWARITPLPPSAFVVELGTLVVVMHGVR